MGEFHDNLWAPWRMQYIRSLADEARDQGCFFCRYWTTPHLDAEHHVLWRSPLCMVVMNRFPYTNGHLMIAPAAHVGDLEQLLGEARTDMMGQAAAAVGLLRKVVSAQGFNIGLNLGLCAGAGVPDHVHAHVVPRWNGDTNFMAVLGQTRVIPDALDALYAELRREAMTRGLTAPTSS